MGISGAKMNEFQLLFSGRDLFPNRIRVGEIAELLSTIEDVCFGIAGHNSQLTKEHLLISLVSIQPGSLELTFSTALPDLLMPSLQNFAAALKEQQWSAIPKDVYEPLDKIIRFLKSHDAQADLIAPNGAKRVLITLTPDLRLPRPSMLVGETVIYGQIVRVGGVEPKVEIKTINGKTLFCPFDRTLASELGALLYQVVGLKGTAKWDSRSGDIVDFRVTSLLPYRKSSLTETFRQLRELAGGHFEDIDDVVRYVASLRQELASE